MRGVLWREGRRLGGDGEELGLEMGKRGLKGDGGRARRDDLKGFVIGESVREGISGALIAV